MKYTYNAIIQMIELLIDYSAVPTRRWTHIALQCWLYLYEAEKLLKEGYKDDDVLSPYNPKFNQTLSINLDHQIRYNLTQIL